MNRARVAALLRQLADELERDAEPPAPRRLRKVRVTEEARERARAALQRAGVDLERQP